jgi:deazaflavin-dependent oxidoreductase (nitroreductase family)
MRIFTPFMDMQVSRYRKSEGPTPPVTMGFPTVLLTTIGSRTGKEHTHVLGGFAENGDRWIVVASKSGAATHPHWFINLCKDPERVWLEIGNRRVRVRPTLLRGAEREAALAKVAAIAPRYGDYQKKTDREIPVIRLEPVSS